MAISPIIDLGAQSVADPGHFVVAACRYGRSGFGLQRSGAEVPIVIRKHIRLKAALRTLASVCRGKRCERSFFAAYVIFPSGEPFSLVEARSKLDAAH